MKDEPLKLPDWAKPLIAGSVAGVASILFGGLARYLLDELEEEGKIEFRK